MEALLEEADERIKRQLPFSERIEEARRRVAEVCRDEGLEEKGLSSGSRCRRVSAVCRRLAI